MLVGDENVGKTSLVEVLARRWTNLTSTRAHQVSGDTISTDGIDITKCAFKYNNQAGTIKTLPKDQIEIEASFWDFAGSSLLTPVALPPRLHYPLV